jgi:anaerobic selenocysteine-containing dehydrogenase
VRAARRIAAASSVAVFEDLGVQMNRHSTLVSYLEKLLWALTGNFGKPGRSTRRRRSCRWPARRPAELGPSPAGGQPGRRGSHHQRARAVQRDPRGDPHRPPDRYRAMIVESGNPAHSLADSQRMREAIARSSSWW